VCINIAQRNALLKLLRRGATRRERDERDDM
jgi:hypothetical protein